MSEKQYTVALSRLAEQHNLKIINKAPDYEKVQITSMAVVRPGLQLTGFYEYYDPERILVYGKQENTYVERLSDKERTHSIKTLMATHPCAFIICHEVEPPAELVDIAREYGVNLFSTDLDTSVFMAQLILSLHVHMAPRQTVHGVLVEVYGEGVLIMGDSGIGKSETALELIKRGHRLIADDAVEIRRIAPDSLVGQAPELIRHYMEFRGIGIVNARYIFGVGAVKTTQNIHLVVHLENWEDYKQYNRLGVESEFEEILGVSIPSMTIPVRPGRNLAVIMELAAMNNRQKKLGYNAAEDLERRHDYGIDNGYDREWF